MKNIVQSVKGTREFYPEGMAVRNWLYRLIGEVSCSFGFQEFDGPFIEKIALYAAKSSEELINEQAFVFKDRGGESVTLRPELTPSLARMVAAKQNELVYPLKWWSFGPFWRYEKPQKGRTREFFQWNIDMIGVNTPEADAEMVGICASFFRKIGLKPDQVKITVNHRELIIKALLDLGVENKRHLDVFHLIDRQDKLLFEEWRASALDVNISPKEFEGIQHILENCDLWKESNDLKRVFNYLDIMGVRDYVQYDPHIIRGLDYYTGIVFEAWEIGGKGRAILGGGHYDNLVSEVGGSPLPGVGFAMGDVVITILLEELDLIPFQKPLGELVLVTLFDEGLQTATLEIANMLRSKGMNVISYPEPVKLAKQLKYADRVRARFAIVLGPEEISQGNVTIRDLLFHTQVTCPKSSAVFSILKMLATS